ncbi:hypothetical protein BDV59DRAFT_198978 [Aspergillus ambiguus]|uniref:uncharacterized protein n=1 Tax=Aspergillus ambiguus TaxID=176160 RepID=UPI003CCD6301
MKIHLPLTLALVASATAISPSTSPKADKKHEPEEKYCKIVAPSSRKVGCQSQPHLMGDPVATLTDGQWYNFGCHTKGGSCLYNHCEWYKVEWDGEECYVNGYYTDCDKKKHAKC